MLTEMMWKLTTNMLSSVDDLYTTQGRLAARRSDTTPHRPRTAGGASPPAVHGRCSFVFFFYFFFHLTCSSYILVVLLFFNVFFHLTCFSFLLLLFLLLLLLTCFSSASSFFFLFLLLRGCVPAYMTLGKVEAGLGGWVMRGCFGCQWAERSSGKEKRKKKKTERKR